MLATLRSSDSASLYQAISGQKKHMQDSVGYAYDDGVWLTYVLNLSTFADAARSFPLTHALREVEFIWMDTVENDPNELALELGEAADRFNIQTGLAKALTVCVSQIRLDPAVQHVLKSRFGTIKYGVTAADLLCDGAQQKVLTLGKIDSVVQRMIGRLNDGQAMETLVKTGKPAVPALVAALKSDRENQMVRKPAVKVVEALVKIGKPAVPALVDALKDSDYWVRWQAAEALGKIEDNSAVPALTEALLDNDHYVRERAVEALVKIGKPAAPVLINVLKDGNERLRQHAVKVLGEIRDKSVVPALQAALKDNDDGVCGQAAISLIKIGEARLLIKIGEPAISALVAALKSDQKNQVVHEQIVEALVKIGKPAVPALTVALKGSNSEVRGNAAWALGRIGDNFAVPALIDMLKEGDSWMRQRAAEALGEIGDSSAISALIDALMACVNGTNDHAVRGRAMEALAKIGKPAVPALIDAQLRGGDYWVREYAAMALGKIGD